jgi:hypothetical protein
MGGEVKIEVADWVMLGFYLLLLVASVWKLGLQRVRLLPSFGFI